MAPKRKTVNKPTANKKKTRGDVEVEVEMGPKAAGEDSEIRRGPKRSDSEIEASVRAGDTQITDTAKQYSCYITKYAVFINKKGKLISEDFNDVRVAGFLQELGELYSFKPHHKKTCLSALHDLFPKLIPALANIHKNPATWPLTTMAIQVF